jgi:hyaluronoglucosaminidase
MAWSIKGIIEGFYGTPWSWDERADVMRFCHERGMTHYVYAPKDDPKHRERWRDLYGDGKLEGFARLAHEGTLAVGFGISPGLSIDCRSPGDRAALAAKVDQVLGVGIRLVVLALDDIPFGGGDQGHAHAELTTWLYEHLGDRASLVLVPTEYVGTASTPYLDALASGVPADVPIAWTGECVVNDSITAAQALVRSASLGDRPPLIWDNYPVNDGIMADRLHLGPLWGREPKLTDRCSGYLANPMMQPNASKLPLASIAAWLRGEDPIDGWAAEASAMDLRVFAEACDGSVPSALVQRAVEWIDDDAGWADHVGPLRSWLEDAAECAAPGLEEEVQPWLDQVHTEARLGLDALKLVHFARSGDFRRALDQAFGVGVIWAAVRRAEKSVMGPRFGLQPMLGQRPDGTWSFRAGSVLEDRNAIDALARAICAEFRSATERQRRADITKERGRSRAICVELQPSDLCRITVRGRRGRSRRCGRGARRGTRPRAGCDRGARP